MNLSLNAFVGMLLVIALAGAASAPSRAATRAEVKRMVVEEANNSSVPPALALAVAKVESDFQDRAESPKGARGVMQVMPLTADRLFGIDADELWNTRLNIQLGIDYLEQLRGRYDGRWDLALSHYNGGPIDASDLAAAQPHAYTRAYVDSVLRWRRRYEDQVLVWSPVSWRAAATDDGWQPARTEAVNRGDRIEPMQDQVPRSRRTTVREIAEAGSHRKRASAMRPPNQSFAKRLDWARRNLDDFSARRDIFE
jgi:soluble lytic murein transglycosylase-like protein